MNKAQKTVVGLAVLLFVLSCVYPPLHWKEYAVRYDWLWSARGAIDVARLTLQTIVLAAVAAGLTYVAGKHKRAFFLIVILTGVSIGTIVAVKEWSAYQGAQAAKARELARFVPQDELGKIQVVTGDIFDLVASESTTRPASQPTTDYSDLGTPAPDLSDLGGVAVATQPATKQKTTMFGDPVVEDTPAYPATKPANHHLIDLGPAPKPQGLTDEEAMNAVPVTRGRNVTCWIKNGTSRPICAVKLLVRYLDESTKERGQYEWDGLDRLHKISRPGSSTKYSFYFNPPDSDWDIHYLVLGITVSAAECPE